MSTPLCCVRSKSVTNWCTFVHAYVMSQDHVLARWPHVRQVGVVQFRCANVFLVMIKWDTQNLGLEKSGQGRHLGFMDLY